MEQKPGKHDMRSARQEAVRGNTDAATVHAGWMHKPKAESEIPPAKLKENPALGSPQARTAAVQSALEKAVAHMYAAEAHQTRPVAGMKTYAIAIMVETLGLTPDDIVNDEGALSDLIEYLGDMIYAVKGIDVRSQTIASATKEDEDVQLFSDIRGTWELPDREFQFGGPYMYQRVEWVKIDPAAGN